MEPQSYNDQMMMKIKGDYRNKVKINFSPDLIDTQLIINELKQNKNFRYKNQLDFSLHFNEKGERNPYVGNLVLNSPVNLHLKIIFKELRIFLNGENDNKSIIDPFFQALKVPNQLLFIQNFGEIWYHKDQIYSLLLFDI
jgi:hypothetical protein